MRITFLGTSAGEGYPAIWCDCENCTYARRHGGKNLRMNANTLIDGDLMFDFNNCAFLTAARLGISLTGVTAILATHPHHDHMMPEPFAWRAAPVDWPLEDGSVQAAGARITPLPMLTVYGNACVRRDFAQPNQELFDGSRGNQLAFREIFEGVREAHDGFAFTPVRANHGPERGYAYSFILEKGGKTLLYALDTGGYDPDMMEIILSAKYDAVIMEGTFGLGAVSYPGHMNRELNLAFRNQLADAGCIARDTPFFLTHMSPHWTPPHDLYAPMMAAEGMTVAYDGMIAEI